MFSRKLAHFLKDKNIYVNSNDTGLVCTQILKNISNTYGITVGFLGDTGLKVVGSTPDKGALTSLFLAASPYVESQKLTGVYLVPKGSFDKPSKLVEDDVLCDKLCEVTEKILLKKLATDYSPMFS